MAAAKALEQEGYSRVQTPSVGGGSAVPVRVKFGRLIAYSTLQLPLAMAALPVVLNVSHFYGEVLKLSFGIMGAIFIFARVVDAIQDPVIGLISDRFTHRGPRGRLIFVALTLPVLIAGFYMLFDPPNSLMGDPGAMAIWLLASLLLVHLGYSGVSISYHAHGAELTDDYNERTKITVGREVFGLIGMTAAVVLPTILTAKLGQEPGYAALGLVFLPIALLLALPTLLGSPSSVHPAVVREAAEIHVRDFRFWILSWAPSLKRPTAGFEKNATLRALVPFFAPMKNRLFRRLLLVFIVNGAALGVAVTVMLFYVEHVLEGSKIQAGVILLLYFIAGAASVPLWLLLSRRLSKGVAWFTGMVMTAIAMSLAVFIGSGDFYWFLAISVVTGLGIGADYGLPPSILADIINSSESKDTKGDTGAYFGLWALATKLATAIGAAGSLPVAELLGFNPAHGHYDKFALVFVYIVLPVTIKIIAALLLWFIRVEAERGTVREEILGAKA